ncbi:MAG: prolipoprotein diacylglyceryl transferase [Ruminococcaceae bacterium]|nr:prolipoprotein diacylglyceryl transferase [Oscillospiraceae bacterium]
MPNTISFPGLGIGEFVLNPVAFTIFGHDIMWYGIIITVAMIVGFFIALRNAKIENIKKDDVYDLAIFLIIFSMVGARLYYVLMKLENYNSFWDVINVRKGGLAIYGGVIAGALTVFVVSKIKKINPLKMLDMVAPGLIIGQAIGRWGNFTNAEAHGVETKLPWRMGIMYAGSANTRYYHPTFLYESLWNILGFVLLMIFYRKKKFNGQITVMYMIWYGTGRFFIEGLRTDSLYIFKSMLGETVRVSQVVALLSAVIGVALFIVGMLYAKERALDGASYDRVYSAEKEDALGVDDAPAFDIVEADKDEESAEEPETEESGESDTEKETN